MKWLRQLFDFYIDGSIHVAFAVAALTMVTQRQLNIYHDPFIIFFVFFSTIVTYNFIKYGSEAKYYFIVQSTYHRLIQFFSLICFGFLVLTIFKLRTHTLVLSGGFLLVSTLYVLPFISRRKSLRSLFGVKAYVVAFCWAGVSVFLPVVNAEIPVHYDVWITSVQRFLFVLAIILPFEIRDLNFDDAHLGTIPQRMGIRNTKILGSLLMLVFVGLCFAKDELTNNELVQHSLLAILTILMIWMTQRKQSSYYCSFFVEGLSIVWFGLVVLI